MDEVQRKPGVNTIAERAVIENMTYDDYLSAVYSYEEASADSLRAQAELETARRELDNAESALHAFRVKDEENRRRYSDILGAEIVRKKDVWKKSQARFDFKISNRKAVAAQTAKNDIQNKKDEYETELKEAKEKERSLNERLSQIEKSYSELKEEQRGFNSFTGKSFPPADENVLAVLERAGSKRLLSPFQREMLDDNIDRVCNPWISGFDGLVKMEKKLPGTEFYRLVKEGRVTPEIIRGLSNTLAAFFAVILALTVAATAAVEANAFTMTVRTLVSTFAFGGLFASGLHLLRERVAAVRRLPIPERVMIIAALVLGCVPGFFIGAFVYAPAPSVVSLLYGIPAAAACALLFRRTLRTKLSARLLSKVPALQDRARKNIFREFETKDNGIYNFMIFCYLRHDAVLQYLSMQYTQAEIDALRNKLDFNRKDAKYFGEQAEKAKSRVCELTKARSEIDAYERERNEQLAEEIRLIEAERPKEPDFEEEAKKSLEAQLEPLDREHSGLFASIGEKEAAVRALKAELDEKTESALNLRAKKKRIACALRSWKKTPMPASTEYRLLDAFCLDTKTKLRIIHHELRPYVIRYSSNQKTSNPSGTLAPLLYCCVRGLCKINPRRLIQINIFDYISDPSVLVGTPSFKKLSDRGVTEGIYSMKEFEIRLFSNAEGYSTFKDFFRLRCGRVGSVIRAHREEIPNGVKPDLALANSFHGDGGEMFPYQICFFIVPREGEGDKYRPPKGILDLIDRDSAVRLGILPIFFADSDSVAPEWKHILEKYPSDDYIFALN